MDRFLLRSSSVDCLSNKRPADENIDWLKPKKTMKPLIFGNKQGLNTANRFSGLPRDVVGPSNLTNPGFNKNAYKTPPIFVDIAQDWTHGQIKDMITKYVKDFNVKYQGNNKVAVRCASDEDHKALKIGLSSENVPFHTYSRKDERPYKVIVRGLPDLPDEDLKTELSSRGFANAEVTKLITKDKLQPHVDLFSCPLYLILLPPGTDIYKFRQIKYLCHCVVQIQKFKPNTSQCTQCYRCQRFGHASKNCNLPVRCVKCTEPHATRDCPKKDRTSPAKCCNCQEDHPANFSKCKERTQYLDALKKKKEERQNPVKNQPTFNANRNAGISWAEVTRGVSKEVPRASSTTPEPDVITQDIMAILQVIKTIKSEFASCSTMLDKVMLVLSRLGQYV